MTAVGMYIYFMYMYTTTSLAFLISETVDLPMLNSGMIVAAVSPKSSLSMIRSFWLTVNVTLFHFSDFLIGLDLQFDVNHMTETILMTET